ncbi:thiamine ABC transporter substrate binding subunit [Salinivibrio sp. ES.052]|uniref:thiamine ABC transporter substrate binding subunit n=1 Tax=Salinivibrio sp. ES.052 TaxID=1882823 RepID=UPI00092CC00C|nr:thiamine ABC transporter substrate binding subunit [Salinivibrio sp. ES.052]SIO27511.1 thiamine transport system substrate-binding protein [Salinivibrio sp. ES.052]
MKHFSSLLILLSLSVISLGARAADPLTVYTYDSFIAEWGAGPKIKTEFEKRCDCQVEFVSLNDGAALLNRLRIEGETTKADIVLGMDTNLMKEAERSGIVAEHAVNTERLQVPGGWDNKFFIPYDYGYFAFVYDTTRLLDPPKSLKALIEERDDISVIYQDPRISTVGQGLMLWIQKVYGDNNQQAWRKLADNTITVTKGWTEAYNMFLNKEADMVLSYTSSPAYHLVTDDDDRFAAAMFEEGHYMQIEVAAKSAYTDQPERADAFLQFMLSDAAQSVIPTTQWMYPVTDISLPDAFYTLNKPEESLLYQPDEVMGNRQQWVRDWQTALVE